MIPRELKFGVPPAGDPGAGQPGPARFTTDNGGRGAELNRVHPGDSVFEKLNVVCRQYLDKSTKTLKTDGPDLINHNVVSIAVACDQEPKGPRPESARHRANYRHPSLVHRHRTNHDTRATFLLFVPSPRRI